MPDITKGATVRALKREYGLTSPTGGAFVEVRRGDELQVLHVLRDGRLKLQHIREDRYSVPFILELDKVEGPLRPLGEVPPGGIPADHPGLDWLWEDAERVADISGFCIEYDRLLKTLNLPGRLRTYTVRMAAADGIEIVAKVKARSRRLAEEKLRQQLHNHTLTASEADDSQVVLAVLEEQK